MTRSGTGLAAPINPAPRLIVPAAVLPRTLTRRLLGPAGMTPSGPFLFGQPFRTTLPSDGSGWSRPWLSASGQKQPRPPGTPIISGPVVPCGGLHYVQGLRPIGLAEIEYVLIKAGRTGQLRAFAVISIGLIALFAELSHADGAVLARYIDGLHPILAAALAASIGMACFAVLVPDSGFAVIRTGKTRQGVGVAALVATAFAAVIIVVDTFFVRYPRNLNTPLPVALVLYPALGLVVEIIFHVLPLTLLWLTLRMLGLVARRGWMAAALIVVAVIEPTFQIEVERQPGFTWIHVFLFNSAQLLLFKRYDFVTMASLRLFYYVYWHMAWGVARLHLLF